VEHGDSVREGDTHVTSPDGKCSEGWISGADNLQAYDEGGAWKQI